MSDRSTNHPILGLICVLLTFHCARCTGATSAGRELFISPGGDDRNAGTAQSPLATLQGARDRIRTLAPSSSAPSTTTVFLADGTYPQREPFELKHTDSGADNAPIIYRAAPNANPIILDATSVDSQRFTPVTDPQMRSRFKDEIRDHILQLKLAPAGITPPPTYPNVFADQGGMIELFLNGHRMPMARYPAVGFMTMQSVLDNAGGATKPVSNESSLWSRKPASGAGGTFQYRSENADFFRQIEPYLQRGAWLKGYWRVMWQNEAIRIGSIDLQSRTVTFAAPVPGGIGSKYHRPEGSGKEEYWALNLPEAIRQPGQWCVDSSTGTLYLLPPADFASQSIRISSQHQPLIHTSDASNVQFIGLTVEQSAGDGIVIEGGHDVLVAGCRVRRVDGYGIALKGGMHHTVQSCDLYDLGAGGVWLSGGDDTKSPRIPAGHRVVNNHIHDFAQIIRVYAAGIDCGFCHGGIGSRRPTVGMYVAHNLIHDTPHVGVLFGGWDNLFEYNEVFRYCQVSDDMGGFYCYDDYDHLGNQTFRFNFVHTTRSGDGFYWDHDHREMHVFGNIAMLQSDAGGRGTGFLFKIGSQPQHPTSIDCTNNIAIGCNIGFQFVSAMPGVGKIERNVANQCAIPFIWETVTGGKAIRSAPYPTSQNVATTDPVLGNPALGNPATLEANLGAESRGLHDLLGFNVIPIDQIGLYKDEYRQVLPTDRELERFNKDVSGSNGGAYDIEDRN